MSNYKKPEDFSGSSNNVYTYTDVQSGIKDQMNQNSQAWWDAYNSGNTSLMQSLEQANKSLATQLGSGVTYDSHTGYWSGASDVPTAVQTGVAVNQPTYSGTTTARPTYSGYNVPKPVYTSQYQDLINQKLDALLNREAFSYNAETDPLYQQYKTQYNREGTRAMQDTMAAAAINAGGMNSYAMTAAQQANDYYAAQLNDKIPELYQLAYSMYMDDLSNQRSDLSMLQGLEDTAYGRYRDEVGDWESDRNFNYNQYRDTVADWENDRNFGYNQYRDEVGDYQWGTEFNYGVERDQIADQRYDQEWEYALLRDQIEDEWRQKEWDYAVSRDQVSDSRTGNNTAYDRAMELLSIGVMPTDEMLSAAGITAEQAKAILGQMAPVSTGGSGGSSGGSSGSSSSGSSSSKQNTGYIGLTDEYGNVPSYDFESKVGKEEELDIDWASVTAAGLGPVSEERLAELERQGVIEIYEEGNKLKVRKKAQSSGNNLSQYLGVNSPFLY